MNNYFLISELYSDPDSYWAAYDLCIENNWAFDNINSNNINEYIIANSDSESGIGARQCSSIRVMSISMGHAHDSYRTYSMCSTYRISRASFIKT
jgi:hypothetical protein